MTKLNPGDRIRVARKGGGADPYVFTATVLEDLGSGIRIRDHSDDKRWVMASTEFFEADGKSSQVITRYATEDDE